MIMDFPAPTSSVKELIDAFKEGKTYFQDFLSKDFQKFATKYNFALNDYLYAKLINLSKVKMAFFSSEVVELDEIYVPQNICISYRTYSQEEFFNNFELGQKIVISATAGAGKSCFLRSLLIDIIRANRKFLPLFLELRKVNENGESIVETLKKDIAIYNSNFNEENLDYLLDRKNTMLFLDGFDEVNYDLKPKYLKEVNSLADKYPNLIIIISSRPEYNNFIDWTLYNIARLEELDLSQAVSLIQKIKYDDDVKNRFIRDLSSGLFNKHEGFSSNPLLLTIMLVAYEQYGDIPDKVHMFYDLAYQALFNKHDVTKQSFHRKSLTGLDMYELRKVFSLFCLTSYCKQIFKISETDLNELLRKCLMYFEKDISHESLKLELLNSVPLLMRDGLDFCFTHRSFQEYFTAYQLVHNKMDKEVFDKAGERYGSDNVINMIFDMNREVLEDNWILPKIEKILAKVDSEEQGANYTIKVLSIFYDRIELLNTDDIDRTRDKKIVIGYNYNANSYFLYYLLKKYDCEDYYENLKTEIFTYSEDYDYEETNFYELVLSDKNFISIKDLNDFQKDLVHRMGGHRHGEFSLQLTNYIKDLILKRRTESEKAIDSMIFGSSS